jgi:syndecan 1
VTSPQAPPLADRPSNAPAPVEAAPVVRARTVSAGPGPTARAAAPVQRDVTDTVGADLLKGVPVKEVPAKAAPPRGRPRSASMPSASTGSSASAKSTDRRAGTPQDPGVDLDDLARRLLDPMARLLRTELRRGRERTGRPFDGRR